VLDLRQRLEERTEELDAPRTTNRELMAWPTSTAYPDGGLPLTRRGSARRVGERLLAVTSGLDSSRLRGGFLPTARRMAGGAHQARRPAAVRR